jgi:hypothetical protein
VTSQITPRNTAKLWYQKGHANCGQNRAESQERVKNTALSKRQGEAKNNGPRMHKL